MEDIPELKENIWPKSIRRVLNRCIRRLNRTWTISIEDTPSASVEMTEENVKIILPKASLSSGGGGGTTANGGFKCVASGSSAIRIYYGTINSIAPDEMSVGDVPPCILSIIGSSGVACIKITIDDDIESPTAAEITDRNVEIFADMPSDSSPVYYQQIGSYVVVDGTLFVTPGGAGTGLGDQAFTMCGGVGGEAQFGPA